MEAEDARDNPPPPAAEPPLHKGAFPARHAAIKDAVGAGVPDRPWSWRKTEIVWPDSEPFPTAGIPRKQCRRGGRPRPPARLVQSGNGVAGL